MPSDTSRLNIDKSKPVLVTGGTGYIAGVLIKQLLDLGITVHTTVRDPTKTDRIQYLMDIANHNNNNKSSSSSSGKLKFFKADLLDEGSYDEGMKGCHIVFHTASPFILSPQDPIRDLIDPAVKGTKNVFASASRTSSVQRIVLTSSGAAVFTDAIETFHNPGNVLNEEIWNTTASYTHMPYFLSKVKAEQTAWVIAGSQTQYSLVTVNPVFVMGPGVKYHESSESYHFMKKLGGGTMKNGCPNYARAIVDVRDVAHGHIQAAYNPTANGRHLLVSSNTNMLEMSTLLKMKYPNYPLPTTIYNKTWLWFMAPYIGIPGLTRQRVTNNVDIIMNVDNTKSIQQLHMSYIPLEQTLYDMFQQLIDEHVI